MSGENPATRDGRGGMTAIGVVMLLVFVGLCLGAGAIGALFTAPGLGTWYAALVKPPWNPPRWIFGPVWTTLYIAMAIAAWIIWRRRNLPGARSGLWLFFVQLALNVAWPAIFFTFRSPELAAIEIVVLWLSITATVVIFFRIARVASLLMAIYLGWVTFAAALTFSIWRLNG